MNPFGVPVRFLIVQTIQQMMQRQANINATQVGTQLEEKKLELVNQQQQYDQQYRDAMLKGVMLDPTRANPGTKSIADSQDDNSSPEQQRITELQSEKQRMQDNVNLATINHQNAQPYVTRLDAIDREIRENSAQMMKDKADQAQRAAQTLKDVNSTESLNAAMNAIASESPAQARAIAKTLPRDNAGNLVWNERAKAAISPYVQRYTTMQQAAEQAHWKSIEEEKIRADQLRQQDEERKNRVSDASIARSQSGTSLDKTREQDIKDKKVERDAKANRVSAIADKPATDVMKKSARSTILADSPDAKWDGTIDAYAADVADRANKIRADAARGGEDLSLDDARQQAKDELGVFVSKKMKGEYDLGPFGKHGGEEVQTYTRAKPIKSAEITAGAARIPSRAVANGLSG